MLGGERGGRTAWAREEEERERERIHVSSEIIKIHTTDDLYDH